MLTDFRDAEGRTLQLKLDTLGLTASDYLQTIPFVDGSMTRVCRRQDVLLAASPGLSRVYVCPAGVARSGSRSFWFRFRDSRLAEVLVIHEMLHTLGLGENPPSSQEITWRVASSCR